MKLLHGEKVAVGISTQVGRRGRSGVSVRIVGESSLGWLEAAYLWGARIEAIVFVKRELSDLLHKYFNLEVISPSQGKQLPPLGPWTGLMFATIHSSEEGSLAKDLFAKWLPQDAVFTTHQQVSRSQFLSWVPKLTGHYRMKLSKAKHSEFGGVTTSAWHLCHFSRRTNPTVARTLMTEEHYSQTLQGSLDDTEGPRRERVTFEPCSGQPFVGIVKVHKSGRCLRVYDGDSFGPDLFTLVDSIFLFFWVRANSVWSKQNKILRQVRLHELFGIWDYEGKLESKDRPLRESRIMLRFRLLSPPAKILRALAFHLLNEFNRDSEAPIVVPIQVGKSEDIPFSPLELAADVRAEAACPDDAEIDLNTWAIPDETPDQQFARIKLRSFAVKWWASYQESLAFAWLYVGKRSYKDHQGVRDCVQRMKACRYFKWPRGSRINFYKIPQTDMYPDWFEDMRDGVRCWQLPDTTLPTGRMPNIPTETRDEELLTREKIFRMRFAGYLEKGVVKCVLPRFTVPKAGNDVRVVWNAKSNGHNAVLWADSFLLGDSGDLEEITVKWISMPVEVYLMSGCPDEDYTQDAGIFIKSWQSDIDVGSHFHNFRTHEDDRPYMGVRMIDTDNSGALEKQWFSRYCVLPFGGKCSPYHGCQGESRILELARGEPFDPNSRFQWKKVHLNLPTTKTWDPSLPRVLLLREDGELATQEVDYVDDIHPVSRGRDETNAVLDAKYLKSRMNSYANQADDKKYRRPTCRPGAWKGEILHTDQPFPRKSTTGKKWSRFRSGLFWVLEQAGKESPATLPTTELRRIAGLGVNVTDVYYDARCYLKGFFNALEAFRADRDINGWRVKSGVDGPIEPELVEEHGITSAELQTAMQKAEALEIQDASTAEAQLGYPPLTKVTPELLIHCEALLDWFDTEEPRTVFIRPASSSSFRYYIGDASREGLGGATQYPDGSIWGRRGLWHSTFAEGGSNLREAQNQVNHLLFEVRQGKHDGCAVWAFTDNGCWSAVWRKGLSTAKHLFDLVLQLRLACREHEVYLSVCHISGDRMIQSGIDGLSRGDYDAGMLLGFDVRNFLPLSLTAFDVGGPRLIAWVQGILGSDYRGPLSPEGWFWDGHLPGAHLWTPPPAAALIALRQLSRAKHKRPHHVRHFVIIPRLLYWEEWQSRFEKEMDVWFVMHTGTIWPRLAHEPLLVGISFPMNRSYPWRFGMESQKVVEVGRSLSALSKECHIRLGDRLRELWSDPRSFLAL